MENKNKKGFIGIDVLIYLILGVVALLVLLAWTTGLGEKLFSIIDKVVGTLKFGR